MFDITNLSLNVESRLQDVAERLMALQDAMDDSDLDHDLIEVMGMAAISEYNQLKEYAMTVGKWTQHCRLFGYDTEHTGEDVVA